MVYNQLEATENKKLKSVKVNDIVPPNNLKDGNYLDFNFLMFIYGRPFFYN